MHEHPAASRPQWWQSLLHLPGYYLFLALFGIGAWWFNRSVGRATRKQQIVSLELRCRLQKLLGVYLKWAGPIGGLRIRYLDWPENWERQLSGAILASNHLSLLDAPVLLQRSPHILCVYKGALERTLLRPHLAAHFGYLSNRAGIDTVREAVAQLQSGATLLLFPEGTRSCDGQLGPFEAGAALIALRAAAPVQTLMIEMSSPALSKGRSNLLPPRLPVTLSVRWGERLTPRSDENAHTFTARLESTFRNALNASGSAGHLS